MVNLLKMLRKWKEDDKIIFAERSIKKNGFNSLNSIGNTLTGGHLIIGEEAVKMAPSRNADSSLCI